MATIDGIVTHLRQAVDHLHQALSGVRAAQDTAQQCQSQATRLGADGVADRFAGIIDGGGRLETMLLAGIDTGERLVAETAAIRHGGVVSGTAGLTSPTAPAAAQWQPEQDRPTVKAPTTPGWRQRFLGEVPEHVREAGARLRPRALGERRFTAGVLDGEVIYSGREGKSISDDLEHAPLPGPPTVFDRHVESKVAARMRDEARKRPNTPPHAEIIIDNTVCGTNERDRDSPWTCHKVLPSILPRDSTLVVWTTCDGGRTFWRHTYHGTGERIRR